MAGSLPVGIMETAMTGAGARHQVWRRSGSRSCRPARFSQRVVTARGRGRCGRERCGRGRCRRRRGGSRRRRSRGRRCRPWGRWRPARGAGRRPGRCPGAGRRAAGPGCPGCRAGAAALQGAVPGGVGDAGADARIGQPPADAGEELLAPVAQVSRRVRWRGDAVQGREQLRPLPLGGRVRQFVGGDAGSDGFHQQALGFGGVHGRYPAGTGEPAQHVGLLGQELPVRAELEHGRRAVGQPAGQHDRRGAVRDHLVERERPPGCQTLGQHRHPGAPAGHLRPEPAHQPGADLLNVDVHHRPVIMRFSRAWHGRPVGSGGAGGR